VILIYQQPLNTPTQMLLPSLHQLFYTLCYIFLFITTAHSQAIVGGENRPSYLIVSNGTSIYVNENIGSKVVASYTFTPSSSGQYSSTSNNLYTNINNLEFGILLNDFALFTTANSSIFLYTMKNSYNTQLLTGAGQTVEGLCPDPSGTIAWMLSYNATYLMLYQIVTQSSGSVSIGASLPVEKQQVINPFMTCYGNLAFIFYGVSTDLFLSTVTLSNTPALISGATVFSGYPASEFIEGNLLVRYVL
jgi:hypothetical protein